MLILSFENFWYWFWYFGYGTERNDSKENTNFNFVWVQDVLLRLIVMVKLNFLPSNYQTSLRLLKIWCHIFTLWSEAKWRILLVLLLVKLHATVFVWSFKFMSMFLTLQDPWLCMAFRWHKRLAPVWGWPSRWSFHLRTSSWWAPGSYRNREGWADRYQTLESRASARWSEGKICQNLDFSILDIKSEEVKAQPWLIISLNPQNLFKI